MQVQAGAIVIGADNKALRSKVRDAISDMKTKGQAGRVLHELQQLGAKNISISSTR